MTYFEPVPRKTTDDVKFARRVRNTADVHSYIFIL